MPDPDSIVIVQTAFVGDVVLTLQLAQVMRQTFPNASIDLVVIPRAAELLTNHPSINTVLLYDKRGNDRGIAGFIRQVKRLRSRQYDVAIIPHRSLRSAALVRLAKIPRRIGFHTSAGRRLFTDVVRYENEIHEVDRNLSLLKPLSVQLPDREYPQVCPSYHDRKRVSHFLSEHGIQHIHSLIAIAPGTAWNTKRWHSDRFAELARKLVATGFWVILIGGKEDVDLCSTIERECRSRRVCSAAGKFSLLQSAELIHRCKLLVANDSAPVHLAVAVRTPVVAIFGATVPEFGFAPYGERDTVIEIRGLKCRPCSIHGSARCPIGTFECMKKISSDMVFQKAMDVVKGTAVPRDERWL
jgi:heptosyltransferase-2